MTRRARALVAVLLIVGGSMATGPSASGQDATPTISLVAQSTFNTPKDPEFDLKASVSNPGDTPLEGLTLRVSVYDALPNRGSYRSALIDDPTTALLQPSKGSPIAQIDPGASVQVRYRQNLGFLLPRSAEGRIYPVTMSVLDGDSTLVTLRTSAIVIPEPPKEPLAMGWTFELSHPTVWDPVDGIFVDRSLERSIDGGWLEGTIGALHAQAMREGATAVDIAVSVPLLTQLQEMSDGYRVRERGQIIAVKATEPGAVHAADALRMLREMAQQSGTKTSALPYGVPNLARLITSGLGADITPQVALGRSTVGDVLGVAAEQTVAVPPGSAIDERALARLHALGVRVIALGVGTIEQPEQDKGFAPPPVAVLRVGQKAEVRAITPDPGASDILVGGTTSDPRLAAQQTLGDLAAIWLEDPARARGVALFAKPDEVAPSTLGPLLRIAPTVPWLSPTPAAVLADRVDPSDGRPVISWARPAPIPAEYVARIQRNRDLTAAYRSAAASDAQRERANQMNAMILRAEENALVNDDLGNRWLGATHDEVMSVFSAVHADAQQIFTLTARQGKLPVRITNTSGQALQVQVRLESGRIRFTGANPQTITIDEDPVVLVFPVDARTTGRFPVRVLVETPNGTVMTASTITVRSTAYSRLALLLMAAACLALAAMWVKRIVVTRRKPS